MCNLQHAYEPNRLLVKGLNRNLKNYNRAIPFSNSCLINNTGKIIKTGNCTDTFCNACTKITVCTHCFNCRNMVFRCEQNICDKMGMGSPGFHQKQIKSHLDDWKTKPIPLPAKLGLVDEDTHHTLVPLRVTRVKSPRIGVSSLNRDAPGSSGVGSDVGHYRPQQQHLNHSTISVVHTEHEQKVNADL